MAWLVVVGSSVGVVLRSKDVPVQNSPTLTCLDRDLSVLHVCLLFRASIPSVPKAPFVAVAMLQLRGDLRSK